MPGLGRVPSKPNTSQNRVNQRKTAEFRAKEYAVANKCAQRASTGFPARVSSANTSNGQARLLFFSLLLGTLGTACATARSASHQNVPSAIPHSQQQSHSRPVRSAGSGTAVTPVLPPESCSNPSILPVTISSTHPVDGGHPEGRHSSDDFGVLLDGLFLPASLKLNHLYSTLFPNTHTQLARVVDYSHETDAALGAEIASIFGTDGAQSCPDRNEKIAYLPQV
ncbi:MAG: hypothetical protein O3A45_06055, partial [Proteobacteria bacterium]|nr:hypothetical protein [Pseudomonadota bacterium]